jgi:tetrahydromethanopterin S-methyltransferase subunit G
MDQSIVNWVFSIAGAAIGWVLKVLWDAVGDLKRDVRQIERDVPGMYVRRDDFRDAMRELKGDMKDGFEKVEAALANLTDRLDNQQGRE